MAITKALFCEQCGVREDEAAHPREYASTLMSGNNIVKFVCGDCVYSLTGGKRGRRPTDR